MQDLKKQTPLPYGRQSIGEDDILQVVETLKSPFLTTGPKVREFEAAVAKKVSAPLAVSFSSGTATLHGAMSAAGIGPGDEVLVPSMSFLATANAVVFTGGRPILVDIKKGSFNLDVEDAARKITPRTKAIAPVHFAGEPVNLDAVHALAKKQNLIVIEDAAHALGARWKGKMVGNLSDMTVFSFHPVKHITTGEGGMVTTGNPEFATRLKRFRHHGIDIDAAAREVSNSWNYDMVELGYNYRLTDFQSALGISQLGKLDRFVARRQKIAELYDQLLGQDDRIVRPQVKFKDKEHAWHLYIITLNSDLPEGTRDQLFKLLRAEGIGVNVHYRPIHLHSYYQKTMKVGDVRCPNTEDVWKRIISLPIFPDMADADVVRVVDTIGRIS